MDRLQNRPSPGGRRAGRVARAALLAHTLLALALSASSQAASGELAAAQARGKHVYTLGRSPRGRSLQAEIVGGERIPAVQLPCIQCHRADGRGGWEAGILVPDIRWNRLTASYGVPGSLGRLRAPYDAASVPRCIREGLDATGTPLHPLMPRYAMEAEDLADLVAYLKVLSHEPAPGVDAGTVRVGTLLPLHGSLAAQGTSVRGLLERSFEHLNAEGGVHGRRLQLVVWDAGRSLQDALAAAQQIVASDTVFCLLANGGPGSAPEVLELLRRHDIPVIGPLGFPTQPPTSGSIFYLMPPLTDQALAAVRFLETLPDRGDGPVALLVDNSSAARAVADAFGRASQQTGLRVLERALDQQGSADAIAELRSSGAGQLVLLGDAIAARRALDEARSQGWTPAVLASAVLLGGEIDTHGQRCYLFSPPVGPGLSEPRGLPFRDVLPSGDGPRVGAMGMVAFCAVQVLAEGLKAAGRNLARERLVDEIANLRRLETEVLPPITFGHGRRVGTRGALVACFDEQGQLTRVERMDSEDPVPVRQDPAVASGSR